MIHQSPTHRLLLTSQGRKPAFARCSATGQQCLSYALLSRVIDHVKRIITEHVERLALSLTTARWHPQVEALLQPEAGLIRHRGKVLSVVANAKCASLAPPRDLHGSCFPRNSPPLSLGIHSGQDAFMRFHSSTTCDASTAESARAHRRRCTLEVQRSHGSLAAYLWGFVPDGKPVQHDCETMADVPITCACWLHTAPACHLTRRNDVGPYSRSQHSANCLVLCPPRLQLHRLQVVVTTSSAGLVP